MKRMTRPMLLNLAMLLLLGLAFTATGCGGGGDGPGEPFTPSTAAQFTDRGWQRFESGLYDEAVADFTSAIGLDSGHGEAYAGRAWSVLVEADSQVDFANAVTDFQAAMGAGQDDAYVEAGLACAFLPLDGMLASAIASAEHAVGAEPSFVFSHRTSFNAVDARLVWAFALAEQGSFASALDVADGIVSSGIDMNAPATWVVLGTEYETYPGAVLAYLHHLSEDHAG